MKLGAACLGGMLVVSSLMPALAAEPPSVDLQCTVTETRPAEPTQQKVTNLHVVLISGREQDGTAGFGRYSLVRVVTEKEIDLTSSFADSLSKAHLDRKSGRFDLTTVRNGETVYHAEGSCRSAAKQF